MSHYAVLVATAGSEYSDLEEALAPFNECPTEGQYLVAEEIEDARSEWERCKVEYADDYSESSFEEFVASWYGYRVALSEEHARLMDVGGYVLDGRVFSLTNPNAKWDWYELGGRWSNVLLTLDQKEVDSCLRGEFDIKGMHRRSVEDRKQRYDRAVEKMNQIAEDLGLPTRGLVEYAEIWKNACAQTKDVTDWDTLRLAITIHFPEEAHQWVLPDVDTRSEEVAKITADSPLLLGFRLRMFDYWGPSFGSPFEAEETDLLAAAEKPRPFTYAMLYDGKWMAKGEMGWFAISTNEDPEGYEEAFFTVLNEIPDDYTLWCVDCHI